MNVKVTKILANGIKCLNMQGQRINQNSNCAEPEVFLAALAHVASWSFTGALVLITQYPHYALCILACHTTVNTAETPGLRVKNTIY